jgi:glycogen operon protein
MDLVSYDGKHNEANGEDNRDGANDNYSWNCGWEGETEDVDINALRNKQIKNALCMLLVSRGVPMLLCGDEMGNTQFGNNNAYCHDNDISWIDWSNLKKNKEIFNFTKKMTAFRHAHPVLRDRSHFQNRDYVGSGYADITWHGTKAWSADWSSSCRTLAFLLCGKHAKGGTVEDNYIYVAVNMSWEMHGFELPGLPEGLSWYVSVNTDAKPPEDAWVVGKEKKLQDQFEFLVGSRSVVVLIGKP